MSQSLAPVYRRAADVIRTNGHYTGDYYSSADALFLPKPQCPVCTVGALRIATTGSPDVADDLTSSAVAFFSPRITSNIVNEDPVERIADWNDDPERTHDEVVEALLAAAVAAEAVAA
ncbi:DUF6197 family protein [Streptomyces sp. NPDC054933]